MKTIYKYQIEIADGQLIRMPKGATILTVQLQDGKPYLWAKIETGNPNVVRSINMFGTGNPISDAPLDYIGTIQLNGFVWHVFERLK